MTIREVGQLMLPKAFGAEVLSHSNYIFIKKKSTQSKTYIILPLLMRLRGLVKKCLKGALQRYIF